MSDEESQESFTRNGYGQQLFQCCVMHLNKSYLTFIIQAVIGVGVILFCMIQLGTGVSPDERSIYVGIMSGIVGYFLPNPKIKPGDPIPTG